MLSYELVKVLFFSPWIQEPARHLGVLRRSAERDPSTSSKGLKEKMPSEKNNNNDAKIKKRFYGKPYTNDR